VTGPDALDEPLDRYLAHLRVERALQPNTLDAYGRDLGEYLGSLRGHEVAELSASRREHVEGHLASLGKRGLSRSSLARHLAAIRGLYRFACAEGLCESDPS
jgi:integrase/recombinase XerD